VIIGAEAPSRKSSMLLRVATNDAARLGNGAFPTTTRSLTLWWTAAANSFGL
jgi:hypothetical protein